MENNNLLINVCEKKKRKLSANGKKTGEKDQGSCHLITSTTYRVPVVQGFDLVDGEQSLLDAAKVKRVEVLEQKHPEATRDVVENDLCEDEKKHTRRECVMD